MAPMADNFNHSCKDVTSQTMCASLHAAGEGSNLEYDETTNYLIDHQQVFKARGYPESEIKKNASLSRQVYQVDIKQKSLENMRYFFERTQLQVWQFPLFFNVFDGDGAPSPKVVAEDGSNKKPTMFEFKVHHVSYEDIVQADCTAPVQMPLEDHEESMDILDAFKEAELKFLVDHGKPARSRGGGTGIPAGGGLGNEMDEL